jgi:hypothetical protein
VRARGFTLPLTTALAFSLMSLAGGVVGLVVVNARMARSSEREVADLVTLESAVQGGLFALQRDGAPVANTWKDAARFNGRSVEMLFAPTKYKPDINRDPAADVQAALADADLKAAVGQATAPAAPGSPATQYRRFADFLRATGVNGPGEDCLRLRLTIGRVGAKPEPRLAETALIPDRSALAAGDLIDVRAAAPDGRGGQEILWMRARYTGQAARPWRVNEWRRLHLGPRARDCPPVPPQPLVP